MWSGTNWAAQSPANKPGTRWDVTMAFDPAMGSLGTLVLYGGYSGSSGYGDTWTWSGTNWAQLTPQASPGTRWEEAMAYDSATTQLLLFGGYNGAYLGDTWAWNGTTWGQLAEATPPTSTLHVHGLRPDHEPDGPVRRYGHLRLHRRHLDNRAPSVTALSTVSPRRRGAPRSPSPAPGLPE